MSNTAFDIPDHRMTSEEFFRWIEDKPGRYELHGGRVYPKSVEGDETVLQAERGKHTLTKQNVFRSLDNALRSSSGDCRAFIDGLTVRCADGQNYIPDALVNCGPIDLDSLFAPNPVIVVEVLSPSSRKLDGVSKLTAYLTNERVQHFVLVDPDHRRIIHHRRIDTDWHTRIIGQEMIRFDPPGIEIDPGGFFDGFPPDEPPG